MGTGEMRQCQQWGAADSCRSTRSCRQDQRGGGGGKKGALLGDLLPVWQCREGPPWWDASFLTRWAHLALLPRHPHGPVPAVSSVSAWQTLAPVQTRGPRDARLPRAQPGDLVVFDLHGAAEEPEEEEEEEQLHLVCRAGAGRGQRGVKAPRTPVRRARNRAGNHHPAAPPLLFPPLTISASAQGWLHLPQHPRCPPASQNSRGCRGQRVAQGGGVDPGDTRRRRQLRAWALSGRASFVPRFGVPAGCCSRRTTALAVRGGGGSSGSSGSSGLRRGPALGSIPAAGGSAPLPAGSPRHGRLGLQHPRLYGAVSGPPCCWDHPGAGTTPLPPALFFFGYRHSPAASVGPLSPWPCPGRAASLPPVERDGCNEEEKRRRKVALLRPGAGAGTPEGPHSPRCRGSCAAARTGCGSS